MPFVSDLSYPYMTPITVAEDGVAGLIDNVNLSILLGVDNLNPKTLKNIIPLSSEILRRIFNQSLSTGQLPKD